MAPGWTRSDLDRLGVQIAPVCGTRRRGIGVSHDEGAEVGVEVAEGSAAAVGKVGQNGTQGRARGTDGNALRHERHAFRHGWYPLGTPLAKGRPEGDDLHLGARLR